MDTISCGATIAWAFEAFSEGALTLDDTDGLDLTWGNAETVVKLTELIARREGFGEILAQGSEAAAKQIGRGTEKYLITSKGLEAPAHMPQVKRSLGLIYAVNPFGADHCSSEHDSAYEGAYQHFSDRLAPLGLSEPQPAQSLTREKLRFAMTTQHTYGILDSLNLCIFVFGPAWQLYGPAEMVEVVRAVTGWEVDLDELQRLGERRVNMMRAFNARENLDRRQDTLPDKFFTKALQGGPSDGWKLDREEYETALDQYYELCGWDPQTGNPGRAKLTELGLGSSALEDKTGRGRTILCRGGVTPPLQIQEFNPGVASKHRFKTDRLVKLLP